MRLIKPTETSKETADIRTTGVVSQSNVNMQNVSRHIIADPDHIVCSSSGATDFFSAPHIVSREIFGELGPLINIIHDISAPDCIAAEDTVLSTGGAHINQDDANEDEVMDIMQKCVEARTQLANSDKDCKFTIVSRNIRNLLTHRHDAMDCQADMQVLQECDLMEHQQFIVNNAMRQADWQGYYGDVTDISKDEGKRRGRRVATFIRSSTDTSVKFSTDESDYKFLMDSGRWVEVTIPTSKKGFYVTVANIYGISGASQGGEAYNSNERLLAAAGRRACTFKNHPYFLMGDCNDSIKHSKVLSVLVEQRMLYDIAAEFTKPGQPVQKTFSRDGITSGMSGPGKTRIDFIFSNDCGIRVVDSFEYLFDETQGFDHLPMKLTLNIKAFTQNMTILTKSAPINLGIYDPKVHDTETKTIIWNTLWEDRREGFREAIMQRNVDLAHNIWCAAFEDYLHTLLPIEETKFKLFKRTRGLLQAMRQVALTS
jgi:endonuclease/exonuclease/phosphatase family metal-dependent hydrolase